MNAHPKPTAGAEEICMALEDAVLRYFPLPAENVDAFLFARSDNTAMSVSHSAPLSKTSITVSNIKHSLRFFGLLALIAIVALGFRAKAQAPCAEYLRLRNAASEAWKHGMRASRAMRRA